MSEQFDPYRKWLGIPPKDQPPNHYRLLGIPRFEEDPDVIENAADRQMAHVRTYQSGQHATASQKILNELSAAKLCLLDPEKKARYDEKLEAELTPGPPPPPIPPPAQAAEAPSSPPSSPASKPAGLPLVDTGAAPSAPSGPTIPVTPTPVGAAGGRARPMRKSSNLPIVLIGSAAAVLVVALLGVFAMMSGSGDPDEAATTNSDDENWLIDAVPGEDPTVERPRDRRPRDRRPRPVDEPPATDFGLKFPAPDEDTGGLDDFGSGTFDLPTREEQVRKSLIDAREALSARDPKLARRHLDEADLAKAGTGLSNEIEDVRLLIMYYDGFAGAARRGARSLKTGTEIELGGQTVTVVSAQQDTITYNDGTAEQQIDYSNIPPDDAVTLARRIIQTDNPFGDLQIATFLAFDRQGDREANLAESKRLWHKLAQNNLKNAALGRELGIYDEVAGDATSPDNLAGVEPPPFADATPDVDTQAAAGGASGRTAVPDIADLRAARTRVARDYRQHFAAAHLPAQKSELAKAIYKAALEESDDAYRYALMEKARDMAVDLAVPDALLGIVDEMAAQFEIDAHSEKATYLAESIVAADTVAQNSQIFDHARRLYDEAYANKNYEAAAGLADVAARVARKAKKFGSMKSVEEQQKRVEKIVDAKQKADAARETLENNPYDPDASEALGRYECFYQENWSDGLPHLAKAANERLQKLATDELAQPSATAEQMALADAWLALGEETGDVAGDAMRRRALQRYRHLAPYLTGDEKAQIDQRIGQLATELDKPADDRADDSDDTEDGKKTGGSGST